MSEKNIVEKIVARRRIDAQARGFNFGFKIPEKRMRPVNPFMQEKGVILEVKRASPSKGDIAPDLDAVQTARKYAENGAGAISCLTEENYFKGSLQDLMDICNALPDVPVLRKDFLLNEEEIEIAYRCGADAVLLICGILTLEELKKMAAKCRNLGIRALVEVRTESDVQKVLELKKEYEQTIVCGVNARNLKDFSIDLLMPAMLKKKLGGHVIFESGITTEQAAQTVASMGFQGCLLGEYAARNPENAGRFVKAFKNSGENAYGRKIVELAERIYSRTKLLKDGNLAEYRQPMVKVCGLTRKEDVLLADSLGAAFTGFIFASGYGRNVCGKKFEEIRPVLKDVKAFKVAVITDPDSPEAEQAALLVEQNVLDFIQLHGIKYNSVPDFIRKLPHYFALTGKDCTESSVCSEMFSLGQARFLQDCRTHEYGSSEQLWLAGGVDAQNIRSISDAFKPELIDVSSGLEDGQTGIKSSEKMRQLFKALEYQEIAD